MNFRMIDVGAKDVTRRRALATGKRRVADETLQMIRRGHSPKGDILAIAEVAGIMAAKNTSALLPLCHPLPLDSIKVWFHVHDGEVEAFCEVICHAKTGVEMEALVGVNTALLTVYDLAKAVDPVIEIDGIFLLEKEGGKAGHWRHPRAEPVLAAASTAKSGKISLDGLRCAVLTLSDRAAKGVYEDQAGPLLREFCSDHGGREVLFEVIPDEKELLQKKILTAAEKGADLVLLTGGTGIGDRDISPEAVRELASKELIGFGEAQRSFGAQFTDAAWLSRSTAFVVGRTVVVLFPGSPKAVRQGLEAIGHLFAHAVRMVRGGSHG